MKTRITKFFSAIQNILGIKKGSKFTRAIPGVATSVTVFIGERVGIKLLKARSRRN